jgi:aminoglycoside phosphotransferase (APT) family kinase protein
MTGATAMTHPWDQTIKISSELISALLSSQFNLQINHLSLLGQGYDNLAYLINKEWVFRFPRRESGVMCIENEIALLPYLADKISFPFSHPTLIGKPDDTYPFPFAGYRFIPGTMLAQVQDPLMKDVAFAKTLAQWLRELHDLPVVTAHENWLKGDHTWRLNVKDRENSIFNQFEKYRDIYLQYNLDIDALRRIMQSYHHVQFIQDKKVYLHGDLYAKHVLMDAHGQLAGLIDWGDVHIGHPGIDLSGVILILTDDALAAFFDVYGKVDQNTLTIATFRAFCHACSAIPYLHLMGEEKEVRWMIAGLQSAIRGR